MSINKKSSPHAAETDLDALSDAALDREMAREIARDMGWSPAALGAADPARIPRWCRALLIMYRYSAAALRALAGRIAGMALCTLRSLVLPTPAAAAPTDDPDHPRRSRLARWAEAIALRGSVLCLLTVVAFLVLVEFTTRPTHLIAGITPESEGLAYQPLTLFSADGTPLAAWFIPAISPDDFLHGPHHPLPGPTPAALLVHSARFSQAEYLPLAALLHQKRIAVLLLECRGQGESAPTHRTFGLRETEDVLAGVSFLRGSAMINPHAIALLGDSDAALAVLRAAVQIHPALTVLDRPPPTAADHVARLLPAYAPAAFGWCYRAVFSALMQSPLEDLDVAPLIAAARSPIMVVIHPSQSTAERTALLALAQDADPCSLLQAQPAPAGTPLDPADQATIAAAIAQHVTPRPARPSRAADTAVAALLAHQLPIKAR